MQNSLRGCRAQHGISWEKMINIALARRKRSMRMVSWLWLAFPYRVQAGLGHHGKPESVPTLKVAPSPRGAQLRCSPSPHAAFTRSSGFCGFPEASGGFDAIVQVTTYLHERGLRRALNPLPWAAVPPGDAPGRFCLRLENRPLASTRYLRPL